MTNLLSGTAHYNQHEHLDIGGCDTVKLAEEYGTPLYIYDVALIRERAQGFKKTFEKLGVNHRVTYASKAFTCLAMYQLLQQEGLACDVVSGGELFTALKAGVKPQDIVFHGNNKTPAELQMAVEAGIGTIILDNFYEISVLEAILQKHGLKQHVLLRLTPGVDADTHKFILTGQEDSKFGFDMKSGQAEQALLHVSASSVFVLDGVHCHIGSQIFDTEGFQIATERMLEFLVDWRERFDFTAQVLNMGGGFGVRYVPTDDPLQPETYVEHIVQMVQAACLTNNYPEPAIWIEPGRSIVAEAGTALYTIGARKEIPTVRTFISVDGGMGDNIRPALYQAEYTAMLASRSSAGPKEEVTIVGKFCESGDMLIQDITLPVLQADDLIALPSAGAYGYSMASNYNRNPRPAVIFVENGQSQLVIRRETYEDLIRLDIPLN